jgi:hypothetical protein
MPLRNVHSQDSSRVIGRRLAQLASYRRAMPIPAVDPLVISRAERACCCLAKPSVLVIMPPTRGRPHQTDLLMCWHHYRASRHSLAASGATALDADGRPVPDVDWPMTL